MQANAARKECSQGSAARKTSTRFLQSVGNGISRVTSSQPTIVYDLTHHWLLCRELFPINRGAREPTIVMGKWKCHPYSLFGGGSHICTPKAVTNRPKTQLRMQKGYWIFALCSEERAWYPHSIIVCNSREELVMGLGSVLSVALKGKIVATGLEGTALVGGAPTMSSTPIGQSSI